MRTEVGPLPMSEREGVIIDRYLLTEHLASQSHAEVYRACRLDDGVEVTVKLPSVGSQTDWFVEGRWWRECALTEALATKWMQCRCDLGEAKSEEYLVFEATPALSVRQALSGGEPLPPESVWRWGEQLAAALAGLHTIGLIHRDVRPDNVYVRPDLSIQVVSSGYLEAAWGRGRSEPPDPAGAGADYLSPELLRGDAGDPRSDVYSWGVTMQELLGACRPGGPVEPVVLTAMDLSPWHRYPDAVTLAQDLYRLLHG
jgi:eukaryotic-like serine/threonine-protein kinase